jgi:hypothetical protein
MTETPGASTGPFPPDQSEGNTRLPVPGGVSAGVALTTLDRRCIRWCVPGSGAGAAPTSWLWDGYLARGNITLLTSQWKAGKTTLLALLLARLGRGGQFAGRGLRVGKAVVLSEEPEGLWEQRREKLGLGAHVCLICRPFRGKPAWEQWRGIVDDLLRLWEAHRFDLLAIDTLGSFLPPGCENNADRLIEALAALRPLTDAGMAAFLTHHPAKGQSADGQAARGTGAFGSHCDIVLEMKYYTRPSDKDRRRRLFGYSRLDGTPAELVIELNADGSDYTTHGDVDQAEFAHNWETLRLVLAQAGDRLTRGRVYEQWPETLPRPEPRTLARWLEHAFGLGLICRRGGGRKGDAFRYWLPGREEAWRSDPAWLARESRRQARQETEREIEEHMKVRYGVVPPGRQGGS